jgi:hypothetical protein
MTSNVYLSEPEWISLNRYFKYFLCLWLYVNANLASYDENMRVISPISAVAICFIDWSVG